jgi:hypothetical protein
LEGAAKLHLRAIESRSQKSDSKKKQRSQRESNQLHLLPTIGRGTIINGGAAADQGAIVMTVRSTITVQKRKISMQQ